MTKRFADHTDGEILKTRKTAIPINTEKSNKSAAEIFHQYLSEKQQEIPIKSLFNQIMHVHTNCPLQKTERFDPLYHSFIVYPCFGNVLILLRFCACDLWSIPSFKVWNNKLHTFFNSLAMLKPQSAIVNSPSASLSIRALLIKEMCLSEALPQHVFEV